MGQIQGNTNLSTIATLPAFIQYASALLSNIVQAVNGNLQFDSNMKTQTVSVTFKAASQDTSVAHNLNKTGVNFICANKSAPCDVYVGQGAATSGTLVLRGTAAASVTLVLF